MSIVLKNLIRKLLIVKVLSKTKCHFSRLPQNKKILLRLSPILDLKPLPLHLGIVYFYIKLYRIFIKMFHVISSLGERLLNLE